MSAQQAIQASSIQKLSSQVGAMAVKIATLEAALEVSQAQLKNASERLEEQANQAIEAELPEEVSEVE
jgi:uncharacterized coiled-coil protein SlyX